jgi:hypothetical protein
MRCCGQFGQRGRSIAAICVADAGLNSGMVYRADLDARGPKGANVSNPTMALSTSGAVFNIAQIDKFHPRKVNESAVGALILRFKY